MTIDYSTVFSPLLEMAKSALLIALPYALGIFGTLFVLSLVIRFILSDVVDFFGGSMEDEPYDEFDNEEFLEFYDKRQRRKKYQEAYDIWATYEDDDGDFHVDDDY